MKLYYSFNMNNKEIAIIGPTASGKTATSIEVAQKLDGIILSLDSLSVYKEIDIASAKPSLEERAGIKHFGIDEVYLNEEFSVSKFFDVYSEAKEYSRLNFKPLVIVGGSGFYLKSMIDGLSKRVELSNEQQKEIQKRLQNLDDAYRFVESFDSNFSKRVEKGDKYRIEKALEIVVATSMSPEGYFKQNPPKSISKDLKIFNIDIDRDYLSKRISLRTNMMIEDGLIDEVCFLEKKYGRVYNAMKSIGIKETLDYLDGKISLDELEPLISTHTRQLAKRQQTFNKTQFSNQVLVSKDEILKML